MEYEEYLEIEELEKRKYEHGTKEERARRHLRHLYTFFHVVPIPAIFMPIGISFTWCALDEFIFLGLAYLLLKLEKNDTYMSDHLKYLIPKLWGALVISLSILVLGGFYIFASLDQSPLMACADGINLMNLSQLTATPCWSDFIAANLATLGLHTILFSGIWLIPYFYLSLFTKHGLEHAFKNIPVNAVSKK